MLASGPTLAVQQEQYTHAPETGKRFMVINGCVSFAGNEKT
jgi:hypothetical protein